MPIPHPNEDSESLCIPIVLEEGTTGDSSQAAAICHAKCDEYMKTKEPEKKEIDKGMAKCLYGFNVKEKVAHEIENIVNDLDKDCKEYGYQRKIFNSEITLDAGEREDISLITTDDMDRDLDVVMPGGIDWSLWQKTGSPVSFAHKLDELPVGRGLWVKRKNNGWLGKTKYIEKPMDYQGNWFPDQVFHYVKSGLLAGKSLGFIPTKITKASDEEISKRPELKNVRYMIRKCQVLEWSIAPVPANPQAIIQSVGKNFLIGTPDIIIQEMGLINFKNEIISIFKKVLEPKYINIKEEQIKAVNKALINEIKNIDIKSIVKNELDKYRGRV